MVLWQPNPNSDNGELVPTKWPAGEKTGFFPAPPVITKQLAFDNKAGSSTAQMDGGTVGAYLNSRDLPASTHKQKMMITPVYRFRKNEAPKPFYSSRSTIVTSLDLQVPTAIDGHNPGSNTYVDAEFLFSDSSGALISYGVTLFHNAAANGRVTYKFDSDTKSFMITSPLGEDERYVHIGNGSSRRMSVPWSGWHRYQFDITRDAFAAALRDLNAHYPGALKSVDPTEYSLLEFHLNAELHFSSGPAELGWSMRNLKMLVN